MDHGPAYRRCGCRDEKTGRLLGARCPGLRSPVHGSWYFSAGLPSAAGQRRRVRRGGFATRAAAAAREALRTALLDRSHARPKRPRSPKSGVLSVCR